MSKWIAIIGLAVLGLGLNFRLDDIEAEQDHQAQHFRCHDKVIRDMRYEAYFNRQDGGL